jgi:hypothetical protein
MPATPNQPKKKCRVGGEGGRYFFGVLRALPVKTSAQRLQARYLSGRQTPRQTAMTARPSTWRTLIAHQKKKKTKNFVAEEWVCGGLVAFSLTARVVMHARSIPDFVID